MGRRSDAFHRTRAGGYGGRLYPEQTPKGQGSLWSDLLEVFRARQSVLKPGRGLLISRSLYRQLGGHRDVADPEADLLGRIGKARISVLRSAISFREP